MSSSSDMESKDTREPRQPEGPGDLFWLFHSIHEELNLWCREDLPQITVKVRTAAGAEVNHVVPKVRDLGQSLLFSCSRLTRPPAPSRNTRPLDKLYLQSNVTKIKESLLLIALFRVKYVCMPDWCLWVY